ncbi:MAG: hypothetical protein ACLSAC_17985 [Enterocloster bolteae]
MSIDAAKAKAIPGVEAVVTCFDMPAPEAGQDTCI